MTNFIRLHKVIGMTGEPVTNGEILVNVDQIASVETTIRGVTQISITGYEGYFYVKETFDEIERMIGIYIDDIPANLFFKGGSR